MGETNTAWIAWLSSYLIVCIATEKYAYVRIGSTGKISKSHRHSKCAKWNYSLRFFLSSRTFSVLSLSNDSEKFCACIFFYRHETSSWVEKLYLIFEIWHWIYYFFGSLGWNFIRSHCCCLNKIITASVREEYNWNVILVYIGRKSNL